MSVFLDSANPDDARRAQSLGFVEGLTTNPDLIARTGRPGLDLLGELVEIFDGHVFYQLTASAVEARVDEAWEAHEIRPDKVVVALPALTENFTLAARLEDNGIECAITAVTTPAQAYLASRVEAAFVLASVPALGDMARLLEYASTKLVAVNLTAVDQAVAALLAGADHISVPLDVLLTLGNPA